MLSKINVVKDEVCVRGLKRVLEKCEATLTEGESRMPERTFTRKKYEPFIVTYTSEQLYLAEWLEHCASTQRLHGSTSVMDDRE